MSIFPSSLKFPWVSPLWKGESRALAKNYRPVSLVSNFSKVFEKVIRKQMVKFINDNNLYDPSQHGARDGRSTITQLIEQHDKIVEQLEKGEIVELIYLDITKAFDTCD